jgi:hypothetical protein
MHQGVCHCVSDIVQGFRGLRQEVTFGAQHVGGTEWHIGMSAVYQKACMARMNVRTRNVSAS